MSHRVGDTVTLVYLPGRLRESLRLYGFLGLRSDIGLVRRRVKPPSSPLKNAVTVVAVIALFGSLIWSLYALSNYHPVEFTVDQGVVAGVGSLVIGVPFLASLVYDDRRTRANLTARNEVAAAEGRAIETVPPGVFRVWWLVVTLVFGGLILGALITLCGAWTLNALLDDSPAKYRAVEILDAHTTTHHGIIRTYEVSYHFLDDPNREKHEYSTGPDELARLTGQFGRVKIRAGRFGWAWLEVLEPAAPPGP